MSATIFTLPTSDEVWDLRQQILMLQEVALRFFDAENWWGAYKALTRVELLSRRLSTRENAPLPEPGPEPGPAASPPAPMLDGRVVTPEEAHAHFTKALRDVNEKRAHARRPPLGAGKMLGWCTNKYGRPYADAVRAVEARLNPAPSG